MAAYLIADIEVTDPDTYAEYRRQAPPTVEQYGGRYLVRGGDTEVLEGHYQPRRVVVLEFPDMETLQRWYTSEEYRGPRALRQRSTVSRLIAVQGL